ncbi:MAG: hypothetical protein MI922_13130 [Bacteroidales bacterium]|nr:hypothetical protein [Bacteroidales bacterium]
MRRFISISFLLAFTFIAQSQVFNTSTTLRPGKFSVGIEPVIYVPNNDFSLFMHGGVGLAKSIDFGAKLGVFRNDVYIGGDIEFSLARFFSLSFGAHSHGNFALDGTALFTFPLGKPANLYTGLDSDVVFIKNPKDDVRFPLWIPLGLEVKVKRGIAFLFEAEIAANDPAEHMIGGGFNFFF